MVQNLTRQTALTQQTEIAATFWRRLRGLMFRRELPPGQALLIYPCQAVHMMHMRFSLDVIFLDKAARVVGLEPELAPWRVSRRYPDAYYALELPAGSIAASGTALGDQLDLGLKTAVG
ncbi:MAG: DUF192 domain-containing protein [Bacillota bacterium]|jgi:uncharacterized membrane protein (UPF0127 family)